MVTSPSYSFRIVSTPSFIIFIKAWHEIVLELYQDSKVSLVSPFGHPLVIEVHHLISLILLSRGPDMFRQNNLWEFFSVNQNSCSIPLFLMALTISYFSSKKNLLFEVRINSTPTPSLTQDSRYRFFSIWIPILHPPIEDTILKLPTGLPYHFWLRLPR